MNIKQIINPLFIVALYVLAVTVLQVAVGGTTLNAATLKCKDGTEVPQGQYPGYSVDFCEDRGGVDAPNAASGGTVGCDEINESTSIIPDLNCKDDGSVEGSALWSLLLLVINILTAGVGVLAVGGIVYGAILIASARDSAQQVQKGITTIVNVSIGLALFLLMFAITNWLIPGGLFT